MKKHLWVLPALLLAAAPFRAFGASTDIVPSSSSLYNALALLAAEHVLPAGAPNEADLRGVTHRLYTRGEFAGWLRQANELAADARGIAALAYARNILAPELGLASGSAPHGRNTLGVAGFIEPIVGGQDDAGTSLTRRSYVLGGISAFGSIGRDGAYTVDATNQYRQTRDHLSMTTRNMGTAGGDSPDVLEGIDEAYVTVLGRGGIRASAGLMKQRWGAGYLGDLLVSDNGPAHPTLQVELPFSLGRFGTYRFTQFEAAYSNGGQTIYQGGRRLEHPIGDRTVLSLEESYTSNEFKHSQLAVLVLPYYTYQSHFYANNLESLHFDYLANAGLTFQPEGPRGNSRVYGQFVLDDIKAPLGLGQGNNTPRKIGYLLGAADSFPRTGTDAEIEYAHVDRATFTNVIPSLAWFDQGLPKGYPSGPNSNQIYARLGQRVTPKVSLAVELRDRRRVANDFPVPTDRSVDVNLAYRLGASQSVGLQFSDYREDPYTGVSPDVAGVFGGAANGQYLRRRIVAVSFLQGF